MPVTDPSTTAVVELSRAEQWVLHHVLLDTIGLADGDRGRVERGEEGTGPSDVVIGKLEAGTFEFTVSELELVHRACETHARTTEAVADRNLASAVADRIEAAVEDGAIDRGK